MRNFFVLLLTTALVLACKKEGSTTGESSLKEPISQNASTDGLLTYDNLEKQVFTVDAGKGATLKGKGGTILDVAKNSFVDGEGKVIEGKVEIELKEAITRADIVLAGLTTTSNGELLESGGMVYVNATANGENIKIAPQKEIGVTVPAHKKQEDMLIFSGEQDAENGAINWVDPQDILSKGAASKSIYVSGSETADILTVEFTAGGALIDKVIAKPAPPVKPARATKGDNRLISIQVQDPDAFPELKKFNNLQFRMADDSEYDPEDRNREWLSVDIKKAPEPGYYILTFKTYENQNEIVRTHKVLPALNGKDLEIAMAEYNSKMKEYEDERKRMDEMRKKYELENKQREKDRLAAVDKKLKETGNVTEYVYAIREFGWSNIDRFLHDSAAKQIELFADVKGNYDNNNLVVSLIFAKKNVFIKGYLDNGKFFVRNMPLKLPLNEPAILLVTSSYNSQPTYAITQFTIDKKQTVPVKLETVTTENLKTIITERLGKV